MRSKRRAASAEVGNSPGYRSTRGGASGAWMVNPDVTPTASGWRSSARTAVDSALGSSQSSELIQRYRVPRAAPRARFMFSLMPTFTALRTSLIRRSSRAYSSSVATVSSSDALSEMTNSRSVKSCSSTDSMQRRTTCGSFRTARPTETVGFSAGLIHDHGLEDAAPAARLDQAAQPHPADRDGLVTDIGGEPPQGRRVHRYADSNRERDPAGRVHADLLERR